jgi:glycosyltransferase involved in cell wall biosynthesis
MKIIHFTYDKSPFMVDLMECVATKMPEGSEFIYIPKIECDDDRAHWKPHNSNFLRIVSMPKNINDYLDLEKPDIIIFVGYHGNNLRLIKKWCKINNKKIFIWAGERIMEYDIKYGHFKKLSRLFVWLKYRLFEHNTKSINGIIACGNRASYLYQENTNNKIPVVNVPYVFDLTEMLNQEMIPFDGKNLTFLISGRMLEFRDPLHTLRLFNQLIPLLPEMNLRLIISGKGPLLEDLKMKAKELNIEDRVSYENNFKDWYDIHQLYYHAHILFCMHTYNGWSLTIQEAMAAGQLVVATNGIDGADQLIIDGYNGLLVHKPSDINTLNEIVKIISNKNQFEKYRLNARESVKSINLDRIATRALDFLILN